MVKSKRGQVATKKPTKAERKPLAITKPFRAFGRYFKGAWVELRQVRWPDRKASWSLTIAVILFSAFFAGLILGLDAVFQVIFRRILL